MKQIQLLKMFKIKSKFEAANKSENRSCNNKQVRGLSEPLQTEKNVFRAEWKVL